MSVGEGKGGGGGGEGKAGAGVGAGAGGDAVGGRRGKEAASRTAPTGAAGLPLYAHVLHTSA